MFSCHYWNWSALYVYSRALKLSPFPFPCNRLLSAPDLDKRAGRLGSDRGKFSSFALQRGGAPGSQDNLALQVACRCVTFAYQASELSRDTNAWVNKTLPLDLIFLKLLFPLFLISSPTILSLIPPHVPPSTVNLISQKRQNEKFLRISFFPSPCCGGRRNSSHERVVGWLSNSSERIAPHPEGGSRLPRTLRLLCF